MFTSNITLVPIDSEIWYKITELIGMDDPTDFVETNLDDDEDEFIILQVEK